ncbi:hypothetical protein LCGC14_1099940, partial [marine sediment metagenome]
MERQNIIIPARRIQFTMNDEFWEGVAIFQSYDLSCALVIMKNRYEAYNT